MRRLLALSMALVLAPAAVGEDLLEVFDRALLNDPQIREADAVRLANREAKPQALATLLPLRTKSPRYSAVSTVTVAPTLDACPAG